MKRNLLLIFLLCLISPVLPQQSYLSRQVNNISEYISSEQFNQMRNSLNHLTLVDSLYLYSLRINDNEISEALLSLTIACIPYRKFPVIIPLLNLKLNIPLISANDSIFNLKNKNLPSQLFFDTPETSFGDKDKLAHFFGNAFIAYNSTILNFGNLPGYFVEVFEESFEVQSKIDERDMTVNYYGRVLGKALRRNEFVLPSQSLILYPLFYTLFKL